MKIRELITKLMEFNMNDEVKIVSPDNDWLKINSIKFNELHDVIIIDGVYQ